LLTLSVCMIFRINGIEFRPQILGRDESTVGCESRHERYESARSEAGSVTMRPLVICTRFPWLWVSDPERQEHEVTSPLVLALVLRRYGSVGAMVVQSEVIWPVTPEYLSSVHDSDAGPCRRPRTRPFQLGTS